MLKEFDFTSVLIDGFQICPDIQIFLPKVGRDSIATEIGYKHDFCLYQIGCIYIYKMPTFGMETLAVDIYQSGEFSLQIDLESVAAAIANKMGIPTSVRIVVTLQHLTDFSNWHETLPLPKNPDLIY